MMKTPEKLYQNKGWLNETYWNLKKNLTEMAQIAKCTRPTIRYWMKKHGIPQRTLSEAAHLRSNAPEYQKAHTAAMRRRAQDPGWRQKNKERRHYLYRDSEWQRKVTEANRRKAQDPEWRRRQAEAVRRVTQTPEWQRKHRQVLQRLGLKKRNRGEMTDIEAICHAAFESLGLDFVFEKFIYPYRVDFFFPSHGIIVEAMGEYWHGKIKRQKRDAERKAFLEASGYTVLEWWGPDIKADVWRLIDEELLPLLDQPSRLERPPHGVSKPYRGPHGWKAAIQLYLFGKEQDD